MFSTDFDFAKMLRLLSLETVPLVCRNTKIVFKQIGSLEIRELAEKSVGHSMNLALIAALFPIVRTINVEKFFWFVVSSLSQIKKETFLFHLMKSIPIFYHF